MNFFQFIKSIAGENRADKEVNENKVKNIDDYTTAQSESSDENSEL